MVLRRAGENAVVCLHLLCIQSAMQSSHVRSILNDAAFRPCHMLAGLLTSGGVGVANFIDVQHQHRIQW
jgi:hypothetical protein